MDDCLRLDQASSKRALSMMQGSWCLLEAFWFSGRYQVTESKCSHSCQHANLVCPSSFVLVVQRVMLMGLFSTRMPNINQCGTVLYIYSGGHVPCCRLDGCVVFYTKQWYHSMPDRLLLRPLIKTICIPSSSYAPLQLHLLLQWNFEYLVVVLFRRFFCRMLCPHSSHK